MSNVDICVNIVQYWSVWKKTALYLEADCRMILRSRVMLTRRRRRRRMVR